MKLCLLCDLHLPKERRAIQYDVLEWAIRDISEQRPDCILFAGDATADGDRDSFEFFLSRLESTGIPFLLVPGNSDLRDGASRAAIRGMVSECENVIGGVRIFAVNDCDRTVSDEQLCALERADAGSVVFLHHPIGCLYEPSRERMQRWRDSHPAVKLFFGHEHVSSIDGNDVSLQALDPDKAIGECPCLTYFETGTGTMEKSFFPCPLPDDLADCFGVSCYHPRDDIRFAIRHGLKYLELRPKILLEDEGEIADLIAEWKKRGGVQLSVHLPDVSYQDGRAVAQPGYEELIALGIKLGAGRFTQHVPDVPVAIAESDENVLPAIARFVSDRLRSVPPECTVGVENMHMTEKDEPNENRRFGYLPEEVLRFETLLKGLCRQKVGVNFDIGHARNNAPYSVRYPIGTWLAVLGGEIVGYHLHQVRENAGKYENHMPIEEVYGRLISFASFFRCWSERRINHAPAIFEIRTKGGYEITLNAFRNAAHEKAPSGLC